MSLLRRRMMMAYKPSGAESITFPVSLIEGDNGEIGVKLFEYIIENADDDVGSYYFKDDEGVYVQGAKVRYATIVHDSLIAFESGEFPGNFLVVYLFNTGVLTIVYD